ncbi:hypothetical protein AJ80_03211 [Polytolypa hystricis UAMH7299]|uniref:NADP-dependent oxidoreductase domain-containing protein n=1 Tax=Polytolypa hystricis (strain UAMH7299) TaxID=1447883 RepID=A0A2B7YJR7_POLH7|nr:hypothetical protein AJ80_03211 [Polytolypa hystricis UAMH7299]
MVNNGVKIVFGGASLTSSSASFGTVEKVKEVLDILKQGGVKAIDTAQTYGDSEEMLGEAKAASRFDIDTKDPGGFSGDSATAQKVVERGNESFTKLKADSVNIFYIHAPDPKTPLEDTLAGINELHKAGKFRHFGLSNFSPDEVEQAVAIAKKNGFVLPSVYQGNYSAVARRQETELFPTLRRHNIAFYAYSPIAGGFLTKTTEQLREGAQGRWDTSSLLGQMYNGMYGKPTLLAALDAWQTISKETGIPKAELAYRWVRYNSHLSAQAGDAIIIGATKFEQLNQTLAGLKNGPLDAEVAAKIDAIWDNIKDDAPLDNYHSYFATLPQQN